MKRIETLIPDIYDQVAKRGWMTDELALEMSKDVGARLQQQYNYTQEHRLRMSALGPKCPHALWCSVNKPESAEKFQPWVEMTFSYGHLLEAWVINIAKAAGHDVCGEQSPLVVDGVRGHRDCVIDGCVVDVKSGSSYFVEKLRNKRLAQDDMFGYLDQLDAYVVGSADDQLVRTKGSGYILGINKQLGHLALYEHKVREPHIHQRISDYKSIVALREPPKCECRTIADGAGGNLRLDTKASYNIYKWECFPELKCFIYADGPRFLSRVVKRPQGHIKEVDRYGREVYNG